MLDPVDEYKFLKDINNIKDIAYQTIFEKYLIQNKKGYDKLTEIESTDQESLIITRNGGYPIPGMIYTFLYGEKEQIELKYGFKEYIDVAPVTFCMNIDYGSFKGINLNMIPSEDRLKFISSYYNTFKDFLEKTAELLAQNNKLALNRRFIEFIKSGGGKEMLRLFNAKNAANFNFAYRSYKIEKVKQLRMLEYNEWVYLPFYEPKDAFRKINQSEMHKLYRRTR